MNILLIGSGAREHALARALKNNSGVALFCFASNRNPGILALADDLTIGAMSDVPAMVAYAQQHNIKMAVVGPEAPLDKGVVDALQAAGIQCVGPTQQLAQIEASKAFARDLLAKHQVAGLPQYQCFAAYDESVDAFLKQLGDDYVVKADGLTGGKGVLVAGEHLHSHDEAIAHCQSLKGPFVIEEKFSGPEFSLISLTDGVHLKHCPAVQDHKRAFEGDTGPNTGGMGSYSDANGSLAFLTDQDIREAHAINQQAVDAMRTEFDQPYRGVLYGGFMKTKNGVKLIEYNARFGDPEAMNLLSLLDSDFVAVCQAICHGNLDQVDVKFSNKATVCKYVVPEGYPTNSVKGVAVDIATVSDKDALYFAAIDQQGDQLIMTGSRAIAVLAQGATIAEAEAKAQQLVEQIKGPVFYRRDIGTEALLEKRLEQVAAL